MRNHDPTCARVQVGMNRERTYDGYNRPRENRDGPGRKQSAIQV